MKLEDWDTLISFGVTPENLTVGGGLGLSNTAITALPENLTVGGGLDLRGTAITALFVDDRNYRLNRVGNRYIAGCRNFSAQEALDHWGSDTYPRKERGKLFCDAIRKEEARRKEVMA